MVWRAASIVVLVFLCAPAPADARPGVQGAKCGRAQTAFTEGYNAYRAGKKNKALTIWLKEADDGHADAQWVVGNMFASGDGMVRPDPEAAAHYYRKSAEQGHLEAQVSLATLYRTGQGVERNVPKAARWLYKAAEAGHPVAQFDLGEIFYTGEDGEVAPNPAHAFAWYRLAARSGVALAQFRLAQMYLEGIGTRKNQKQGLLWLTVARNQAAAPPEDELYWSRRVMPLDKVAETDKILRTLRRIIIQFYEEQTANFTSGQLQDAAKEAANWNPGKY